MKKWIKNELNYFFFIAFILFYYLFDIKYLMIPNKIFFNYSDFKI